MGEIKGLPSVRGWDLLLFFLAGIFLVTGCVPEVLKQTIPVSTNPMGAKVYVDGKLAGETPTTIDLERTHSHILTLVKENYKQRDVVVQQRKNTQEQMLKAINDGVTTGMWFKDPAMGMMRFGDSYSMQEKTGEAYVLWPNAIAVELEPLDGSGAVPRKEGEEPAHGGEGSLQPVENEPPPPPDDDNAIAKGAVMGGVAAGALAIGSKEKRWQTSSSTSTSVRPDGTVVTKSSSTSVGVSVNPLGIIDLIDTLYK